MKPIKEIRHWITLQFKNHTVRSLLIALPAIALITTVILWACGVFYEKQWSYLPNREYILAPAGQEEPQTLNELLHSDMPGVDALLRNPAIAQELLDAETLTDVVDSRLALNNLHDLNEQIAARLAENPETIDVVDMESAQTTEVSEGNPGKAVITTLAYKPGGDNITQLASTDVLQNQYQTMAALKAASEKLLAPKEYDDLVVMPIAMNMKGIVDDDEAMIHLLPAGDWLPTDGYKLYREVNGQSVLIAENVASPHAALSGAIGGEHASEVQTLYRQAELTDTKLSQLGMTASQFRETAYRMDTAESKTRISGQSNFMRMHELLITEPGSNEQKIPETDLMIGSPVVVMGRQANGLYESAAVQSRIWKQFSLTQSTLSFGIDSIRALPGGLAKYTLAAEVMAARQQISTLSFVDDAFAEEAGFLIRDDLSGLGLDNGTTVTYRVETPDHQTSTLSIAYGHTDALTKPQGLMGYGIDGKVPLRWNAAENPPERGIISGYMIERKLDGESEFAAVNEEPVAITYILNENDIYFETLSFYEDAVANGRIAEYRIRSLDIFGRMSEPSDIIKFRVEQVTPPNAPTVSAPVFSGDGSSASIGEMIAVQNAIDQNKGKSGIVLPVFTDSADTVRFTIYRAEAVGARPFGKPEPIANIAYDNPRPKTDATASPEPSTEPVPQEQAKTGLMRVNGAQQTLLKNFAASFPDLVYYDADIKEGITYKYWVSVWDSWNNESAWSQSVSYGVRTGAEPAFPAALNAAMLVRELPDRSDDPPGLVDDSTVMLANLPQMSSMPVRKIPGTDADTVKQADESGIAIGKFLSVSGMPDVIDKQFDNLPEQKYIHMLLAVRGEDVQPGGGAWLRWSAYSGEGLGGYAVYRPVFPVGSLPDLQQMSRNELLQMGVWKKATSNTVTQNQVFVTGLDKTPGEIHLFLICLLPETEGTTASIETNGIKESVFIPEGLRHAQLPIYTPYQIIFADDMYSYIDYYHEIEGLELAWEAAEGNPEYTVFLIEVPRDMSLYNIDKYREMPVDELWKLEGWKRMLTTSKTNAVISESAYTQLVERVLIIAVCVQTGSKNITDITVEPSVNLSMDLLAAKAVEEIHAGFVSLDWDIPDDPQVQFFRVYRAEVRSFKTPADESMLDWTLVGDRLSAPQYTDPVEQSRAHFYYYKVTSVSPWGVESSVGAVQPFRVPSTKPPATPNLLLPLQSKDGVKINFSAVPYCDKYVIYRTEIPRVNDSYLAGLNMQVKSALFTSPTEEDKFLTNLLKSSVSLTGKPGTNTPVNAISRFKTLNYSGSGLLDSLASGTKLTAYQQILKDLGPLALADYRDLSIEMMKRVGWQPVGELRVDYETGAVLDPDTGNPIDPVDPATGLLKPLYIIDRTAEYGIMYLYTVQAWNDDGLGSTRPEPVEATPRRSGPFMPISWLKADMASGKPALSWNTPEMEHLTLEKCLEETVGYVVYRSDTKDGEYYQASPLVFGPEWTDDNAAPYAYNWYRVKVLDTGGYLSEFSEPVLAKINFVSKLKPFIPSFSVDPAPEAPKITFDGRSFAITESSTFEVGYTLTGSEPISLAISAKNENNELSLDFNIDPDGKKVVAKNTLKPGKYTVTVVAENDAGESSDSFALEVKKADVPDEAPKITVNGRSFSASEGSPFEVGYTLTGTEPITVTIKANDAAGAQASGFTVDTSGKKVKSASTLKSGKYSVTVTAKNSAGESSASFTLEVKAAAVITPPVISVNDTQFSCDEGERFTIRYTLSGTEPITVGVKATDTNGGTTSGITVDPAAKSVIADRNVPPGEHHVIVTAKNSAGESSADFYLIVRSAEVRTAPVLENRRDGYRFSFTRTMASNDLLEYQLSATGSEPLTWSLEPISERMTVPVDVSIGQNGILSIRKGIAAKTYSFYVVVSNDVGSDKREITLEVLSPIFSVTPVKPRVLSAPAGNDAKVVTLAVQLPQVTIRQPVTGNAIKTDDLSFYIDKFFYRLTAVSLSQPYPGNSAYYGTGMLDIGFDGMPVEIGRAVIEPNGAGYTLVEGIIYISKVFEIPDTGITISSLEIVPQSKKAVVSGYVVSTIEGQNLMGDLSVLEFSDAKLQSGFIVVPPAEKSIRYNQFTIKNTSDLSIRLSGKKNGANDFITLTSADVTMKSHLETLNNEGFAFVPGAFLTFDLQGRMSGTLMTTDGLIQNLQMLVPGGAALRVEYASLKIVNGEIRPDGSLIGRLILPFERSDTEGPGFPASYAGHHPTMNEMDELARASGSAGILDGSLNQYILKFGQKVQENALLIVPNDFELQEQCSYVPIELHNWNGKGFTVDSAEMTPTRMAERSLSIDKQRSQAVVISPTAVSIDLDREGFIPIAGGGQNPLIQTPKETEKPFWVGLVMKGGTVALPPDFVKASDGGRIDFALSEGEMIYDLNGFNYQNYLYNEQGQPAQFGDDLGGFKDVWVYDCLIDMYANHINIEINAEVLLEHLNDKRVKVKLYTNQEDTSEGKKGEFICSVAPTDLKGVFASGVDMRIDGGFLKPDGMHFAGAMTMKTAELETNEPLAFTDMIVPAEIGMSNRKNDPTQNLMSAALDKPTDVVFQGFSMEIRHIGMECMLEDTDMLIDVPFRLTLGGSTVLAENIPLGQDTTDNITLEYTKLAMPPDLFEYGEPTVLYNQSASMLHANFDDCIEVSGTLVPVLSSEGQSNASTSQMSAKVNDTMPHIMQLSAGGAPALPALPPIPALPDAESILKDAKATAEEKLAAYQKALKDEIDRYKKMVEAELAKYKNMAESEAKKYREEAEKQLKEYKDKAVSELEKYLDITKEELKKYKEDLEKELGEYIDLGKLSAGLIEFNTEQLNLNYLSQLKALPVVTETRFGYDMDNERCYFAVGLMPKNKPGSTTETIPINFGAGDIRNFTGIVTYNMVVKRDEQGRHKFPAEPNKIAAFIKDMSVHRESGSTFAAGIRGTMKVIGFCEIREMYFGFEKGPIINADGGIYIPLDVADMISGDGMKKVGTVSILYDHPNRYFSFSMTLDGIDLVAATVSGSMGFEFSPHMFGVSLGYPETMAGNISIFRFGVGIGFRIDSEEGNYIKAKLEIGVQKDVKIAIVYLSGYLYAGADGGYYWGGVSGDDGFYLTLYLKGGIKGGIDIGSRWDIINLMLDARGTISSIPSKPPAPPNKDWNLSCSAKVSYCLDLFLFSINGSVEASFDTTFSP